MIGGFTLLASDTFVLVEKAQTTSGMVVCERSGGVNVDKTGDLLTALGGAWNGGPSAHYDNCNVEIY